MPLPWPSNFRERPIPDWSIQHRGISVCQLRDIRELLKRVCKVHLLKSKKGESLEWSKINQHHIRHRLVMKVIPEERPCSWVQIVAEREQKPSWFVSHDWAECFRDFMVAIEHHVRAIGARSRDVYWICVFAMNQFDPDVGLELLSGPFVTALQHAGSAVLMLDKTASSLNRLWCLLEVYVILDQHKELLNWDQPRLQILTPMGLLGSPCVSSGPVVEALTSADSRQGAATRPEDRRQILNYIAGLNEWTGMTVESSQGGKQRKQLDVSTAQFQLGDYENKILKENDNEFQKFNDLISHWAKLKMDAQQQVFEDERLHGALQRQRSMQARDPFNPNRGLTLAQLRTMWRRIKSQCVHWEKIGRTRDSAGEDNLINQAGVEAWKQITLYDYVWEHLKKGTPAQMPVSYMENMVGNAGNQEPEYSITVPYSMPFHEIIAAIEWHAEARELPDNTVYWAWFFALSLQDISDWFTQKKGPTPTDIVLGENVKLEGIVIIIDSDLGAFKRVNPAYELYQFLSDEDRTCDICSKNGVISSSKPFAGHAYQFGSFDLEAAQGMLNFDIKKLGPEGERKNEVLKAIALAEHAPEPPAESPLYEAFNRQVRQLGSGPVLRQAALMNDVKKIWEVIEATHISLTSPEVCGVNGEHPLMIAAAAGNLEAMVMLVRMGAEVNAQDAVGETPLHYAAIAGQLEAAKLLVRCHARADLMSDFEERASKVAEQNPSFFLGVDTSLVTRYLMNEEALEKSLSGSLDAQVHLPQDLFVTCDSPPQGNGSPTNMAGPHQAGIKQIKDALLPPHRRRAASAKIKDALKVLDLHGSGRIHSADLVPALRKMHDADWESLVKPHSNKDDLVNYAEFIDAVLTGPPP